MTQSPYCTRELWVLQLTVAPWKDKSFIWRWVSSMFSETELPSLSFLWTARIIWLPFSFRVSGFELSGLSALEFRVFGWDLCFPNCCICKWMQLLPDCSPQSVMHILELAKLTHCQGCRFYRAEGRGKMWDSNGRHISKVKRVLSTSWKTNFLICMKALQGGFTRIAHVNPEEPRLQPNCNRIAT